MNERIIAVTDSQEAAGAIVYCSVSGAIPLDQLRQRWLQDALPEELLPSDRTEDSALKRTLQEVKKGARNLVRPLKGGGFALVLETAEQDDLDYAVEIRAKVVSVQDSITGDSKRVVEVAPYFHPLAQLIRDGFQQNLNSLFGSKASVWIWNRLAGHCNAVSLRDSGGVYFIPKTRLEMWQQMTGAVSAVSGVKFFEIPAMESEQAVEAILDAIVREADKEIGSIFEDLQKDGDEALGERALQTREARCRGLRSKVESYEALLGKKLPELTNRLEELNADVAAATLALL